MTMKKSIKGAVLALSLGLTAGLVGCQSNSQDTQTAEKPLTYYQDKLEETLADPKARLDLIAKVLGSTDGGERHAYMKFHVFGFAGDGNIVPMFTMNNYIIQDWTPLDDGDYEVAHREVAYYSEFDTDEPIDSFKNPFTGEVVELPQFVLGPVPRTYSVEPSDSRASFDADPLNITMIGDRVYVPTLSSIVYPNMLSPEEWGPYSSGETVFWDSMTVFSADVADVFDPNKTHVDADIHMQNLISWAPNLKMGQNPGRSMVRAYGQHINGFDDLPANIRKNLETLTPEIFDENWTEMRMDNLDMLQSLMAKRAAGTLDIDQDDYKPFEVKIPGLD